MNKSVLLDEELNQVTGGTFTPNTYSASGYHTFGISTRYHFFSKDEFRYMGRPITYEQANEIMKIGNSVLCSLNSGYDHKNKIGPNEKAFIRAFNLQLSLSMGSNYIWNGIPGSDF